MPLKYHTCEIFFSIISSSIEEETYMLDAIGERIRHLRQARGLSLRQLAGLAHVPQSTLSCVESGSRAGGKLSLDTGKRLARALGISLDVIAGVYEEGETRGLTQPPAPAKRGRPRKAAPVA